MKLDSAKFVIFMFFLCFWLIPILGFAQQKPASIPLTKDTAAEPENKNPSKTNPVNQKAKRAALLSAILPGLGQAYNKKYWKIPLIYAGATTIAYYVRWNNSYYSRFRNSIILRLDSDPTTIDEFAKQYPNIDQLRTGREYYRRNRDLLVIVGVFVYLLNIADATIDAHLAEFDISDNLGLRIRPNIIPVFPIFPVYSNTPNIAFGNFQPAIHLTFSIK